MEAHLSSRHRDTVEKIFSQPPNRNIEWREVMGLLEAVGTVTHEHNGKLKVSLGPGTEVLAAPRGKDVDVQIMLDLRRMLKQAGFAPDVPQVSPTRVRAITAMGSGASRPSSLRAHRPLLGQTVPFRIKARSQRCTGLRLPSFYWSVGETVRAAHVSVRSIAPVDLEVPDWLIEALDGDRACVGKPDALAATEVVYPRRNDNAIRLRART